MRGGQPLCTLLLLAAAALASLPAAGEERIDAFTFDNEAQRETFQVLVAELRCPKCLNTNLAGSDAPIAADLRREVHRLVLDGMDEDAVREHLLARYGDFILYRPRVTPATWALWFAPPLLLLLSGVVVWRISRSRAAATVDLTDAERERARRLLG